MTTETSTTAPGWNHWRGVLLKAALSACLFVFLALQFADPIRLVTADLGRHLKNGELILAGERGVLTKNFYSYTQPDFPFINHHWASGVIFELIYKYAGGFPGLSFFYIGMLLLTFWIFFRLAQKLSNFPFAFFTAVLAMPIFTDRLEIRPEGISTLLIAAFLYLLYSYRRGEISSRVLLCVIPLLQVLWINVHVFFFMGGFLVAAFFIDAWLSCRDKKMMKDLFILGLLVAAASLINPAGLKGALVPLNIFKEYGYPLAENQTVFFMQKRFSHDPKYIYFEVLAGIAFLGLIAAYWKKNWRTYVAPVLLLLFFGLLGFKTVRSMAMFGFLFVPIAAMLWYDVFKRLGCKMKQVAGVVLLTAALGAVASGVISTDSFFSPYRRLGIFVSFDEKVQRERGFFWLLVNPQVYSGLVPGSNDSATFFNRLNIQGPIFNNYDIGGHLIFHLFPRVKVFVDNRPEVYTVSFFRDTYMPMQENNEVWKKVDAQYHFNAIFFYRHDLTPWGQNFLIQRVRDPEWAPVFVDLFTIIFVRRNAQNKPIIDAFELPSSMFQVNWRQ